MQFLFDLIKAIVDFFGTLVNYFGSFPFPG